MIYRKPSWEADLARAVDLAAIRNFAWWDHDCVTAACRMASAAMGRDLLGWVREPWNSPSRAERVLRWCGGVDGLLNVIGRMAYLSTVRPEIAPRGALVTLRDSAGQLCAGCVVGDRVAVVRQQGLSMAPLGAIEAAWADLYEHGSAAA